MKRRRNKTQLVKPRNECIYIFSLHFSLLLFYEFSSYIYRDLRKFPTKWKYWACQAPLGGGGGTCQNVCSTSAFKKKKKHRVRGVSDERARAGRARRPISPSFCSEAPQLKSLGEFIRTPPKAPLRRCCPTVPCKAPKIPAFSQKFTRVHRVWYEKALP